MSSRYNCGVPVQFEGFKNCNAPQDVICFFDDFIGVSCSTTADIAVWLETDVGAATGVAIQDDAGALTDGEQELTGGWIGLTPEATANDAVNLTVNGESFQIDQGYPLYFETRIFEPDISDCEWWIGLTGSTADTEIITGGLNDAGVGFETDNAGALNYLCATGASEKTTAASGITIANGDIWKLAFYYDGVDTITFYAAEESASSHTGELEPIGSYNLSTATDYCPEDKLLTPTIEAVCVGTGANDPVCVDYVLCVQARCQVPE